MEFTIQKLSGSEGALLKQLLELWQSEDDLPNPTLPSDAYLSNLLAKDSFHAIVALDDAHIIGGLTAFEIPTYFEEGTEVFLYEIGVNEPYRQKGVARRLIEKLKEICSEKAIKIVYVGTEMDNLPARQLYHRTGGKLEEIAWFTYELGSE